MARAASKSLSRGVRLPRLLLSDFDAMVKMQARCFPGMKTWSKEQIKSQLEIFPEGQLALTVGNKLAGTASTLIVSGDHHTQWHDWRLMTDGGFIRNHDPRGETLYGMEIMVDPKFRGMRLSRRLYDARKELARRLNLRRIVIGGRIPGYGKHAPKMSAEDYVQRVMSKELVDPVLTPQLANGFLLKGLIPKYFPGDADSRGYATHLEWENPHYRPPEEARRQPPVQVRLCLVQYQMRRVKSFAEFAAQAEFFIDLASDYRSDFVLFPELFTTQLLSITPPERPGLAARRLAKFTRRFVTTMRDLAIKHNVNVIAGSQFVVERGKLYNVSFLCRRNGTVASQKKLHTTPNERKWWGVSSGDRLEVFDTDRGKIAILLCYDVEFPELARLAASRGANIFFVPFNTDERYGYLRVRHCAQARAIENQVYVAIAGCAGLMQGVENEDIHYSQCAIFTPSDFPFARDAIASESTPNIETVVVHDVDVALLHHNRAAGAARPWVDRRSDLYRVVFPGEDGESEEV